MKSLAREPPDFGYQTAGGCPRGCPKMVVVVGGFEPGCSHDWTSSHDFVATHKRSRFMATELQDDYTVQCTNTNINTLNSVVFKLF